jgi:hypothetical protein
MSAHEPFHKINITAWSRILEKPIVAEFNKKFSAFYGTKKIITVFT